MKEMRQIAIVEVIVDFQEMKRSVIVQGPIYFLLVVVDLQYIP